MKKLLALALLVPTLALGVSVYSTSTTTIDNGASSATPWIDTSTSGPALTIFVYANQALTMTLAASGSSAGTGSQTVKTAAVTASNPFLETVNCPTRYCKVTFSNSSGSNATTVLVSVAANMAADDSVRVYGFDDHVGGIWKPIGADPTGTDGVAVNPSAYALDVDAHLRLWNGTTFDMGRSGAANADNVTAPTLGVLQVQGFLYGWDAAGSNWDRVNIESPNNDSDTGHNAISTEAYGMVWNGSSWDRRYGTTTGAYTQGPVAEASPAGGNPLRMGGVVEVEGATMTATNQADQDISSLKVDPEGRLYVRMDHANPFSCDLSAASADSAICTDLSSSTTVYVTDVFVSNGANAGSIIINKGTGTACATNPTVIMPATYLPANSGYVYSPRTPIKITWASGLDICADITSMNPYSVQIRGYYYQ